MTLLTEVAVTRADPAAAADPLNTVGLALLAYGLVQLLSKVVDKLPLWGRAPLERPNGNERGSFSAEDRKRLERSCELIAVESQRLQRMQEALATQQRLIGQALDELRTVSSELRNVARKLRALWARVGGRGSDST